MRAIISTRLREDVELGQALISFVFVFLVTLYLWVYPQAGPLFPGSSSVASFAYLIISIPELIWVIAKPGQHHPESITFTVMDQVTL